MNLVRKTIDAHTENCTALNLQSSNPRIDNNWRDLVEVASLRLLQGVWSEVDRVWWRRSFGQEVSLCETSVSRGE